jgi:hypothetical protein
MVAGSMASSSAAGLHNIQQHEPAGLPPPLSEGQLHDLGAEAADAPMLIVRLAQSKAEWTALHQFLRIDSGLGSEGQISHVMLSQGIHRCKMMPPVPTQMIDEVFAALDPEATTAPPTPEPTRVVSVIFTSKISYNLYIFFLKIRS